MKKIYVFSLLVFTTINCFSKGANTSSTTDSPNDPVKNRLQNKILITKDDTASNKTLLKKITQLSEQFSNSSDKTVQIGLSISYREIHKNYRNDYTVARISPIDSTLRISRIDHKDLILSTCIIVNPFVKGRRIDAKYDDVAASIDKATDNKGKILSRAHYGLLHVVKNSSVYININLVEFNKAETNLPFNKSIEGGFGYALRLSPRAYFRIGNELIFSPQLTSDLREFENKRLPGITSTGQLNENKDLFINKNLIAWSYGLILAF